MTLSCLWILICRTELFVESELNTDETRREAAMKWYQDTTAAAALAAPVDIQVYNLTDSWVNGRAFCLLLASIDPQMVDWRRLQSQSDEAVMHFALTVLQRQFGAPPVAQAQDFMRNGCLDEQAMLVYLHMIRATMSAYDGNRANLLETGNVDVKLPHASFLPGGVQWRFVFGEFPHEPLQRLSDRLLYPTMPIFDKLQDLDYSSMSMTSSDGQHTFAQVVKSCGTSDDSWFTAFVDRFREPAGRLDMKAAFCAMILCTDKAPIEMLRLMCAQFTSSNVIDALCAADLWTALHKVGKFAACEAALQFSQLFDANNAATTKETFRGNVVQNCKLGTYADRMTAAMFDEFRANTMPLEVFCNWCSMKPEVQLWTDWLGWWCRLGIARLSSSPEQYWSERSQLYSRSINSSLAGLEATLSVVKNGQISEPEFLELGAEIGVGVTTAMRLFRLFDPQSQKYADAYVAKAALALLGPESRAEKIAFIVQAALAVEAVNITKLVHTVMQPFALVAREVMVCSITSLGDLLFSSTKSTKDLLAESCVELDNHVDHLTAVVRARLGSERINCAKLAEVLQDTPGVDQWIST